MEMKTRKKTKGEQAERYTSHLRKIKEKPGYSSEEIDEKTRFQALFNAMVDPVVIVDSKGKFLEVTDGVEKITGFKKDELIGKNFLKTKIVTKKSKAIFIKNLAKRMMGVEVLPYEIEVVGKDGGRMPYEVNAAKIDYMGKPADMVVFRDIAERKQAEEALIKVHDELESRVEERTAELIKSNEELSNEIAEREKTERKLNASEKKYHDIIESSADPTVIVNTKGKFLFANQVCCKITGYKPEEIVGKTIVNVPFITKKSKAIIVKNIAYQLTTGKSIDIYAIDVKVKSGDIHTFEIHTSDIEKDGKLDSWVASLRDITGQKKLEETLRGSEQRFKDIAYTMADWIWEMDQDGKYTFSSGNVKEILGYTSEELIGKTPFDLMPKKEAYRVGKIVKKIFSEKKPITDLENINLTKNGNKVFLLTNGTPILGKNDELIGYRGIDKDITKRKIAEQTLKESEERYKTIFDNSAVAIMLTDENERIISWNKYTEKLFDMPEDELLDTPVKSIYPSEEWSKIRSENIRQKGMKHFLETKIYIKDHKLIDVDVSLSVIKDHEGKIIGSIGIIRDITQRKKAEKELKNSNEHFQTLFKNMTDPVIIVDSKGKILEFNNIVTELTDFKREDLAGKNIFKISLLTRKSKLAVTKSLVKRMAGVKLKPYEIECISKGGKRMPFEISAAKIKYNGKPADMVILRDVTQRKKAEDLMKSSHNELEYIVKERTAELAKSNKTLTG